MFIDLKQLRKELGMTANEFGTMFGRKPSSAHNSVFTWDRNKTMPLSIFILCVLLKEKVITPQDIHSIREKHNC